MNSSLDHHIKYDVKNSLYMIGIAGETEADSLEKGKDFKDFLIMSSLFRDKSVNSTSSYSSQYHGWITYIYVDMPNYTEGNLILESIYKKWIAGYKYFSGYKDLYVTSVVLEDGDKIEGLVDDTKNMDECDWDYAALHAMEIKAERYYNIIIKKANGTILKLDSTFKSLFGITNFEWKEVKKCFQASVVDNQFSRTKDNWRSLS